MADFSIGFKMVFKTDCKWNCFGKFMEFLSLDTQSKCIWCVVFNSKPTTITVYWTWSDSNRLYVCVRIVYLYLQHMYFWECVFKTNHSAFYFHSSINFLLFLLFLFWHNISLSLSLSLSHSLSIEWYFMIHIDCHCFLFRLDPHTYCIQ